MPTAVNRDSCNLSGRAETKPAKTPAANHADMYNQPDGQAVAKEYDAQSLQKLLDKKLALLVILGAGKLPL